MPTLTTDMRKKVVAVLRTDPHFSSVDDMMNLFQSDSALAYLAVLLPQVDNVKERAERTLALLLNPTHTPAAGDPLLLTLLNVLVDEAAPDPSTPASRLWESLKAMRQEVRAALLPGDPPGPPATLMPIPIPATPTAHLLDDLPEFTRLLRHAPAFNPGDGLQRSLFLITAGLPREWVEGFDWGGAPAAAAQQAILRAIDLGFPAASPGVRTGYHALALIQRALIRQEALGQAEALSSARLIRRYNLLAPGTTDPLLQPFLDMLID